MLVSNVVVAVAVVVVVGGSVVIGDSVVEGVDGDRIVVGHISHCARKVSFSGEQTAKGTCASAHT